MAAGLCWSSAELRWRFRRSRLNRAKGRDNKNRQNSAKIIRKIDFPYNNFPKKAISLRKCTKVFPAFGEKKQHKPFFFSRLRRDTAATPLILRGGGKWRFPAQSENLRSDIGGNFPKP